MGFWSNIGQRIRNIFVRQPKKTKKPSYSDIEEEIEEEDNQRRIKNVKVNKELEKWKEEEAKEKVDDLVGERTVEERVKRSEIAFKGHKTRTERKEQWKKEEEIPRIIGAKVDDSEKFMEEEANRQFKENMKTLMEAPTVKELNMKTTESLKDDYGIKTVFNNEYTIDGINKHLSDTIKNQMRNEDKKLIEKNINNLEKVEGRFTTTMRAELEEGEVLELEFMEKSIKNLSEEVELFRVGKEVTPTELANMLNNKANIIIKPEFKENKRTYKILNVQWSSSFA